MYAAQQLFREVLAEAPLHGVYTEEELADLALQIGLWDEDLEKQLETYVKDMQDFKVKLYEFAHKNTERTKIRNLLNQARERADALFARKTTLSKYSATTHAAAVRNRYILGVSLCNEDGSPYFKNDSDYWRASSEFLDILSTQYIKAQITEAEYREIARSEPWRSLWDSSAKAQSIFGIPVSSYNEDQREISLWSKLYDSVYEHPECPSQTIIEDNDMLDGFLILKKKEWGERKQKGDIEGGLKNEKIRNSQEVYLMSDGSKEELQKIENMNDASAKIIKKQRNKYIDKVGEANELDLPDVKKRLHMEANRKFAEDMRKRTR
jgi:hypothetical protein